MIKKCIFIAAIFLMVEFVLFNFVDLQVSEYLRQVDREHHAFINFFRAYTDFGKSHWYLWPSGILAILLAIDLRDKRAPNALRDKKAGLGRTMVFIFLTVAVSGLVTDAIKPIIGRARPVMMERAHTYGFSPFAFDSTFNSMPSGHATTAFALAFALAALLPRWRGYWLGLGFILAISRVMVNAHYISDVIAGGMVGFLTVFFIQKLLAKNGMLHLLYSIFPIDRKNPIR